MKIIAAAGFKYNRGIPPYFTLVREFLDPTPGRNCTRNGRICGIYRRRASSGER